MSRPPRPWEATITVEDEDGNEKEVKVTGYYVKAESPERDSGGGWLYPGCPAGIELEDCPPGLEEQAREALMEQCEGDYDDRW